MHGVAHPHKQKTGNKLLSIPGFNFMAACGLMFHFIYTFLFIITRNIGR